MSDRRVRVTVTLSPYAVMLLDEEALCTEPRPSRSAIVERRIRAAEQKKDPKK